MAIRQVVLDTETTGHSTSHGHRIIEVGCLELVDRKLTGESFHSYVNPDRDIDPQAQAVHGLSRAFLSDHPPFSDIWGDMLDFIRGAELLIHNAPFDVGFIDYELALMRQHDRLTDHCQILDTLIFARRKHPGQKNSLDALCKRYGVNNSRRTYHGALLDSELLAQVYLAMTQEQGSLLGESAPSHVGPQAVHRFEGRQVASQDVSSVDERAHRAYLKWMQTTYGHCAWLESQDHV